MYHLREDRFFASIPFVSQKDFENSQFLKLYNATDRTPETYKIIASLRQLRDDDVDFSEVIDALRQSSSDCNVIATYTSNLTVGDQTFYNYINEQLCRDDRRILKYLIPLIRRGTSQINNRPPLDDCYVYRGMKLADDQRRYFQIGCVFRFPGFTSTSISKHQAQKFGDVLFKIHIDSTCLQVRDISDISYFPYEQEYIFSPYSLFKVTGIKDQMISLKAIDNLSTMDTEKPKPPPILKPLSYSNRKIIPPVYPNPMLDLCQVPNPPPSQNLTLLSEIQSDNSPKDNSSISCVIL